MVVNHARDDLGKWWFGLIRWRCAELGSVCDVVKKCHWPMCSCDNVPYCISRLDHEVGAFGIIGQMPVAYHLELSSRAAGRGQWERAAEGEVAAQ